MTALEDGLPKTLLVLERRLNEAPAGDRQMRQARIYTCTRNPHLRLFFVAVALILRNVWV